MKKSELIRKARRIVDEIKKIEDENGVLGKVAEGPAGIFSVWPTGMPRGTNEWEAAIFQRSDVNNALDSLERLNKELDILLAKIAEKNVA